MKQTSRRFAGLVALALLVAACGGANVVDPNATSEGLVYGTPSVTGVPMAAAPSGGSDPAAGAVIPSVTGQAFDGSEVVIDPADGRAKAIVFLAHWCPHCQDEVPEVQAWIDANGMPANVDLYSVATSTSSSRENFPPAEWLESEGWTVPVIVDAEDQTIGAAFGLSAFPFWVFVDAEGRVLQRVAGALPIDVISGAIADLGG